MDGLNTRFFNEHQFPLLVEPKNIDISIEDFCRTLHDGHRELHQQLLKFGGLLFRNFPLKCAEDFSVVANSTQLGHPLEDIGGGCPRSKVGGPVYTSSEAPPSLKVPLQNELSYPNSPPDHVYLYCDTAPINAGEGIIADARKVYSAIDPDVLERFEKRQLRYTSRYYYKRALLDLFYNTRRGFQSWCDVFETELKEELEEKCRNRGLEYRWLSRDWIEIRQTSPAVKHHPKTGEPCWFNQAHLYAHPPKRFGLMSYLGSSLFPRSKRCHAHDCCFGDGSMIPREDLDHILEILDANTVSFPWQEGDLLALDNTLTMHGIPALSGPRKILTVMTA